MPPLCSHSHPNPFESFRQSLNETMGSEELGHENRAIYNLILATVTILGLLCGYLMHHDSPLPPSVRLDSLHAAYSTEPSSNLPQKIRFMNTTFFLKIAVSNEEKNLAAVVDYLDVWVNSRAREFLRVRLGQKLMLDMLELGPGETKEMEVEVPQDHPMRVTEWSRLLVSVFVRAKFPSSTNVFGHTREAHKTRNCVNLNATLDKTTNTAVVDHKQLSQWCVAPY